MQEINEAFDQLMGAIRTGNAGVSASNEQNAPDEYVQIRRLINDGQADEALRRLQAIGGRRNQRRVEFFVRLCLLL